MLYDANFSSEYSCGTKLKYIQSKYIKSMQPLLSTYVVISSKTWLNEFDKMYFLWNHIDRHNYLLSSFKSVLIEPLICWSINLSEFWCHINQIIWLWL